MIKQNCIPLECPSEWKEALKGIKHSFGQTWENCYSIASDYWFQDLSLLF